MRSAAGAGGPSVALEPVGKGNRAAILALELLPEQQGFVASNAESLAEARRDRLTNRIEVTGPAAAPQASAASTKAPPTAPGPMQASSGKAATSVGVRQPEPGPAVPAASPAAPAPAIPAP